MIDGLSLKLRGWVNYFIRVGSLMRRGLEPGPCTGARHERTRTMVELEGFAYERGFFQEVRGAFGLVLLLDHYRKLQCVA